MTDCNTCRYLYHNPTPAMKGRCSKREGLPGWLRGLLAMVFGCEKCRKVDE